jgi:hypothetical protein
VTAGDRDSALTGLRTTVAAESPVGALLAEALNKLLCAA